MMGAALMVMVGVLSAPEAFACIDGSTLMLLLGLMMILGILEAKGIVDLFVGVLMWGTVTPLSLLTRVSLLSGVMSAFIMNDGAALILSLVVVKICDKYTLPLSPYMMAMATSANIGSAATPLGNPKNMVVHAKANISFIRFVSKMGPPALVGLVVNTVLITLYYRSELSTATFAKSESSFADTDSDDDADDEIGTRINKDFRMLQTIKSMRRLNSYDVDERTALSSKGSATKNQSYPWMQQIIDLQYKTFEEMVEKDPDAKYIYDKVRGPADSVSKNVVDPGKEMDLAKIFRYPVQMSDLDDAFPSDDGKDGGGGDDSKKNSRKDGALEMTSTGGGGDATRSDGPTSMPKKKSATARNLENVGIGMVLLFMYVAFLANFPMGWTTMTAAIILIVLERSAQGVYDIDWQILIYIIGMFVVITGINKSPLTNVSWNLIQPLVLSANPLFSVGGFCLLVIVLSFVFTSIPTVLLVSPHLEDLTGPMRPYSWFLLALSVTLCGNLTIFGSVAGVIASQKAEAAGESMGFMQWFKFAFPSTLLILALGATVLVMI
mmetsp:Transcript_41745/g.67800  ORF Transcript_41745/g.67800 Transcript_41745/m.67800 type:complete len:551 (-) Transcript_41745:272-1924(-)